MASLFHLGGSTNGLPLFACAFRNASVRIGELSVRIVVPMPMKKLPSVSIHLKCSIFPAYPNVAAEPSMYWPNVLNNPFGPGPYRMMFVAPKMNPMMRPTAVENPCQIVLQFDRVHILPPIIAPILTIH